MSVPPSSQAVAQQSTPLHLNPRARITSIQVCRGLAAMLVVLAHLHNLEFKYFGTNRLGVLQYGVSGVDIFFVISGVVISAVTANQDANARNALGFLYQRCARIFPIYWIYTALVCAAFLHNPLLINAASGHRAHIASSFFLIPTEIPMLLLQGWTLSYELYFYLIFFVLLLVCPRRWRLPALLLWGATALTLHLTVHIRTPVQDLLCNPLLFEFLFGCLLFALYRRSILHPYAGMALLIAAALWFCVILQWTARLHGRDQGWIEYSPIFRPALYGSLATLFVLGLMELERSRLVSFAGPLVAIGDWSYSMYLSHTIVLKAVFHVFTDFAPTLSIGWVLMVSIPAVLLVSYLSFTYLERPLMKLLGKPGRRPVKPLPHARGESAPA